MPDRSGDLLLALWLLIGTAWSFGVMGVTAYAVFWLGASGWWFCLAVALASGNVTLFRALAARFGAQPDA